MLTPRDSSACRSNYTRDDDGPSTSAPSMPEVLSMPAPVWGAVTPRLRCLAWCPRARDTLAWATPSKTGVQLCDLVRLFSFMLCVLGIKSCALLWA